MKFEGFEIKLDVERGIVKVASDVKNGNLPIILTSRKGVLQKIDCDIAGYVSKIYEEIMILEAAARLGQKFVGFPSEHCETLISDDGYSHAVLRVIIPKNFAKDRIKRLTNSSKKILYRGVLTIESVLKGGHHHDFTSSPLDLLKAESASFELVRFPKVEELFHAYCRKINAFFETDAPLPFTAIIEDLNRDNSGTEVTIKVTFSVNPEIVKTRIGVINAYRNWFRGFDVDAPQKPTKPKIPEKTDGQVGIVLNPKKS